MTHCPEWENLFKRQPDACVESADYRRKVEKWLATLEEIRKRGIQVTTKIFPEGAHRVLPVDGPIRTRALEYICHKLERGEKITAPDLKKSIAVWEGKDAASSCPVRKNNTNVLSPPPDNDVKKPDLAPVTLKDRLQTATASQPSPEESVRAEEIAIADANQHKAGEPPAWTPEVCKTGKCPDPNGKSYYQPVPKDGKQHLKGDVCGVIGVEIKQLPGNECPLIVNKRKREMAAQAAGCPAFTTAAGNPSSAPRPITDELRPLRITKTPMTGQERKEWADAGIDRGGFFTKKEVEQIDELVKAHYEGIKSREDFFWRASSWFLAQAEGE